MNQKIMTYRFKRNNEGGVLCVLCNPYLSTYGKRYINIINKEHMGHMGHGVNN